jgi:hypothetical protein
MENIDGFRNYHARGITARKKRVAIHDYSHSFLRRYKILPSIFFLPDSFVTVKGKMGAPFPPAITGTEVSIKNSLQ